MIRFTDLLRQELSGQTNLFPQKSLKGKGKVVDDNLNNLDCNLENTELLKKIGKLLNYWKQNVKYINNKDKDSRYDKNIIHNYNKYI